MIEGRAAPRPVNRITHGLHMGGVFTTTQTGPGTFRSFTVTPVGHGRQGESLPQHK